MRPDACLAVPRTLRVIRTRGAGRRRTGDDHTMASDSNSANDLTLYEYYQRHRFNPVYAGLTLPEELAAYERRRREMFEFNLRMPAFAFDGRSVLEFGPASGENSLVFALWGARLQLVEPVETFLHTLNSYFTDHKLNHAIDAIANETFERFQIDRQFDFVIAEGFIFHVGSPEFWIPKLVSFASDDAYIIISHCETAGFIVEMIQAKSLQILAHRYRDSSSSLALELFQHKWGTVAHSRQFDAWVADNLMNPKVTSAGLNYIGDLIDVMAMNGMALWSSWPSLQNHLDVSWIKKPICPQRALQMAKKNALGLIPSLLIGEEIAVAPCIYDEGETLLLAVRKELDALSISAADSDNDHIDQIRDCHRIVEKMLARFVTDFENTRLSALWTEIDECLCALNTGDRSKVIELFNSCGVLANCWGSPNFYSVWHRLPPAGV